ncbi:uncharacterized protein V3H82_019166 [Fundulus diaphanus]
MSTPKLYLEALSALSGCNVEATTGPSQLTSQDFVNIVALREYYKQRGLKELLYESVGSLSLENVEDQDMYSAPLALTGEGPASSLKPTARINVQDFFHPEFNYDFTNIKDGDKTFLRGNEKYTRPCGWRRIALRVLEKYDNNHWLGTGTDAWPVSYHGHNMDGSLGIILTHKGSPDDNPSFLDASAAHLLSPDTRGKGVYSTPDIKLAEKYCKTFKSSVDGKTYKVALQNRINPQKRKNCQREDIWVVYIPEDYTDPQRKAIVEEALRPYGLLLKQV